MNKFEKEFFKRYISEQEEVLGVIHKHFVLIIDNILIYLIFGFLLPVFLLYNSIFFQELLSFYYFEIFFLIIFGKLIFEIFDWYNDAWIVTNSGIVSVTWGLFDVKTLSIKYENIEGIEIIQDGFFDTILKNGRIVLHKIGSDSVIMEKSFLPYDTLNLIEDQIKENEEDEHNQEEEENVDKFDLLIHTLSGIVEDYMGAKGYQKKKKITEEDIEKIEKLKKKNGTIDLSE
ncbi:MAG: PH domain-containing protein [Candidatus Gracilibacteria bacterium]|nr:PH domain-containing protein [Candidatus Gracilibacteria bacterium]